MFKSCALCVVLALAAISVAHARPVKIWQPAELLKEADVVVIATAKATTDIKDQQLDEAKADTWVAVETEFDVQAVVKGTWKQQSISVRHHRVFDKQSAIPVPSGPVFIDFDPAKKNSYQIYLKLTKEGWYVPLTGEQDPGDSFFLQQPFRAEHERPKVLVK
jgi:hypothetical protein